jgi:hypothetical protein
VFLTEDVMGKLIPAAVAIALTTLVFVGSDRAGRNIDQSADNVSRSFTRMLEHEPYSGPTGGVAQTDDDPLATRVYAMLRGEPATHKPVAGVEADSASDDGYRINVARSFDYLLDRQPFAGPTSGVARSDQDPVEAALRAALWTNTEVSRVAASGTTTAFD